MKESFREREKERLDGQHEISDMLYYMAKEHRTYLASTVIGNSCFTMSRLEWPAINTYQLYILNNRLKSSMNYIYVRIASELTSSSGQPIHKSYNIPCISHTYKSIVSSEHAARDPMTAHGPFYTCASSNSNVLLCVFVCVCEIHIICNA